MNDEKKTNVKYKRTYLYFIRRLLTMTFNNFSWYGHGAKVHGVSVHLGMTETIVGSLLILPSLTMLSLSLSAVVVSLSRLRRRALHQMYNFTVHIYERNVVLLDDIDPINWDRRR